MPRMSIEHGDAGYRLRVGGPTDRLPLDKAALGQAHKNRAPDWGKTRAGGLSAGRIVVRL
ncbi:MAG: hypothetical protein ACJ8NR_17795 [Sulfurifustis sp.]